jgi:twitching motility two-component system response regulator PilG
LNLKQFDAAAAEFQEALRLRPADRELRSHVDLLLRRQAAAEAARLTSERPRKTVLVVDDSPTICKLVTMTLERRGYRVLTAADGALVADVLREQGVPDLILLDITMPLMDGYRLCKLLRHDRETCHIPIVMLSGKDGIFNKVRGRLAGSTAYITKPFEPEHLLSVLGRYCPLESSVPAK